METLDGLLREHPFLAGMQEKHLGVLTGCASNVKFDAGQAIFREGQDANHFYLIRHGRVAVDQHTPGGVVTLQTVGEGEVLGWSWLVPPHRWRFDARAVDLTRAVALDGACLRGKCEADHDLGYELMKRFSVVIAQRLAATRLQVLNIHGPHA
jgi:CRP-like cAMP-binding protein